MQPRLEMKSQTRANSGFTIFFSENKAFPQSSIWTNRSLLPFSQGSSFSCLFNMFPQIYNSLNLCPMPIDKWQSLHYLKKKKVWLASVSSYHPIIFFLYHQPFLEELATRVVSKATLKKSSVPSVLLGLIIHLKPVALSKSTRLVPLSS